MKVAIVEDEWMIRELIIMHLRAWALNKHIVVEVFDYSSAENFLFDWEYEKHFDLIALDIEMKGITGVELAKKIKDSDANNQIIFITASSDYIFEGFEIGVMNYLLKPLSEEKFTLCLDKAFMAISSKKEVKSELLLEVQGVTKRVDLDTVYYIEAQKHQVSIEGPNSLKINYAFKTIEAMIQSPKWVKCHRSYLVNVSKIRQMTKAEIVFENGSRIPISRMQFKDTHRTFVSYHKNKMKEVCVDD